MDIDNLIKRIKQVAQQQDFAGVEDGDLYDSCGGNYDDAYMLGCTDGEIFFARELVRDFKL